RLRRADRSTGIFRLDVGDEAVVPAQVLGLEVLALLREVAGVARVELGVVGGDPGDDLVYVVRGVPAVRVAALPDADQVADGEHGPVAGRVGVDHLLGARVVAVAVDDHVPRRGDRAGVGGGRLVAVGVGVGLADDGGDLDAVRAELGGEAAPEVLRDGDLDHRPAAGGVGGPGG